MQSAMHLSAMALLWCLAKEVWLGEKRFLPSFITLLQPLHCLLLLVDCHYNVLQQSTVIQLYSQLQPLNQPLIGPLPSSLVATVTPNRCDPNLVAAAVAIV